MYSQHQHTTQDNFECNHSDTFDDDTIESLLNDDLFSQLATMNNTQTSSQTPSESGISYDNGERLDNEEESLPPCTHLTPDALREEEEYFARKLTEEEIPKERTIFCSNCTSCTSCVCKKNKLRCTVKCLCQSKCRNLRKEELTDNWIHHKTIPERTVRMFILSLLSNVLLVVLTSTKSVLLIITLKNIFIIKQSSQR